MSLRQTGSEKVTAVVNAITGLISSHNSSSSAHSTEMAKKVNVAQGATNSGKFLKVNNSGNVVCESVTIPDITGKIDTAGTGLSKSGTTLNHSNSITAQTSTVFKKIKYDAQGHVTGTDDVTASDLPSHTHSDGYSFSFLVGDNSNGISLTQINGIAIVTMNNYGKNYTATGWQDVLSTGVTNRTGNYIYASNGERRFRINAQGKLQMNIETKGSVYTGWAQIIFPYS